MILVTLKIRNFNQIIYAGKKFKLKVPQTRFQTSPGIPSLICLLGIRRENRRRDMASLGWLCSNIFLSYKIRIDFRKATELGLIPANDGGKPITYERFAQFIAPFAELEDDRVRPRYHYGEMRLTRLNWFARFLLGRLTYHHIHAQWNEYLGRFLAPFLTVFLLLSTTLTAMQVELAVQSAPQGSRSWEAFSQVCRWVSVLVLILVVVVSALLILLVLFMLIHDQIFAQKMLRQKKSKQEKLETSLKSGVV